MATETGLPIEVDGELTVTVGLPAGIVQTPPVIEGTGSLTVTINYTPIGSEWRALVVEQDGTRVAELPEATIGPLHYPLNGIETTSVSLPITAAGASVLLEAPHADRELQVWRGDQLMFFGPLVTPTTTGQTVTCTASGPAWHLSRRHVGGERENLLTNPTFSEGITGYQTIEGTFRGWALVTSSAPDPVTEVKVGREFLMAGTSRSLRISPQSTAANEYVQAYQDATVTAPSDRPLDVWFSAYAYVPTNTPPGEQERGLTLQRLPATLPSGKPLGYYVDNLEVSEAKITSRWPLGVWKRLQAKVTVPPGETNLIHAVFGAPGPFPGRAYYALPELYADEGIGNGLVDQGTLIADLVQHAQDTDFGKADANISVDSPATGILRDRFYPYAQHQNIWRAIVDFTDLSGGVDVWARYTPTTRTVVCRPTKGKARGAPVLAFGKGAPNCELQNWTRSGESAAGRVWALGAGGGVTREEALKESASAFGGLTLEDVVVADSEVTVDSLGSVAVEHLRNVDDPLIITVETFPEFAGTFLHGLVEGDYTQVRGEIAGELSVDARMRVVDRTVTPGRETVRYVLNGA